MRTGLALAALLCHSLGASGHANRPPPEARNPEAVYYANAYADHFGLPRELVHAVITHESGWNRKALAYTAVEGQGRAVGLMQLMPATSAYFDVRDPTSNLDNIRGGVTYLAALDRQFHGDLRMVLAAYYCGSKHILTGDQPEGLWLIGENATMTGKDDGGCRHIPRGEGRRSRKIIVFRLLGVPKQSNLRLPEKRYGPMFHSRRATVEEETQCSPTFGGSPLLCT